MDDYRDLDAAIARTRLAKLVLYHKKVEKILQQLVDVHNELARYIQEQ